MADIKLLHPNDLEARIGAMRGRAELRGRALFAVIWQIRHRALAVSPAISGAGHVLRCGERWRRFFPEKLPAAAVHAEATDLLHVLVFRKALTREQVGAWADSRAQAIKSAGLLTPNPQCSIHNSGKEGLVS